MRRILWALNQKNLWNSIHYEQSYRRSFWPTLSWQFDNARSAYANASEFGPRDFDAGKILPPPSNFPQSDLGRRADSRWALLQISSLCITFPISKCYIASCCTDLFPSPPPNFFSVLLNIIYILLAVSSTLKIACLICDVQRFEYLFVLLYCHSPFLFLDTFVTMIQLLLWHHK